MDRQFRLHNDDLFEDADALDTVEAVLSADSRAYERLDEEVHFAAAMTYCDLHGVFVAREDAPSLALSLIFDLKAPRLRRGDITALLALLNEALWLGHFELSSDDNALSWRVVVPLIGRSGPEPAEVAAILAAGVEACERFYPAFNFLLWAGKTPEEAAQAALFETAGEA
ncbi:hypothetical protein PbB2_01766 [Candidatus Phycosocius bacilliformis]|uniref:YbjN domain-containing protein n=1 Tax=Candidatus Phycosocius bacilliformis TaxID=1445552 RepID=A0A2P2EAM0_9PROT|nr:YbjN domain-containing protein [Candidatus Phycosocius bacilliformis]GBF58095.1 hypothetical protein PbB2_01766 [Candidatus Phycosocius bacilliformis]